MVKLIIRKEQRQAQYYTESLGENIGLEMTLIPDGTFLMGSPEDEPERRKHEGPQHQVTVSSFFMGRYPITQAQWGIVAGWETIERKYDMHGNVYEWCEDDYHDSYVDAPTDGSAWQSGDKSTTKILRGGCWNFNPDSCRCAYRLDNDPGFSFDGIGFRVVRAAPRILP